MTLETLFFSGRIVDLILIIVGVEMIVLWLAFRHRSGPFRLGLIANAAAGASLLVALRLALVGAWWGWIAATLLAALGAHLMDLIGRFKA